MKKLIGALALAAMVATSAFAEVSFGAWLCNFPTLVASNGDVMKSGVTNPWGGWRPARFSVGWTSDDGKAGMDMGVSIDNGKIDTFTPNAFWIKPVEQVKVIVGLMDNSFGVRGDLCFGSWNWLRPNTGVDGFWGEGLTFSKYDSNGLGLQITPIEALKIFASVPLFWTEEKSTGTGDNVWKWNSPSNANDTYKAFGNGKIGAAYTIEGIGVIKAGLIGQYSADGDAKKNGTIEAAFDLTAVDKLTATVGVAFTLASSDYWKTVKLVDDNGKATLNGNNMLKVALGVSYGITEAFKVSADFAMAMFNGDTKINGKSVDPAMSFGVGLDYAISDALGAVADFRMLMPNNDVDSQISFLVGLTCACGSNASLGIGFQGAKTLGDKAVSTASQLQIVSGDKTDSLVWAVPVRAQISF